MYAFMSGLSTIQVVVLGVLAGKVQPVRKFTLAKSQVDMAKNFALSADGEPVLGPRVYRERTRRNSRPLALRGRDYLSTLVPLCNCGTPYWVPEAAEAA